MGHETIVAEVRVVGHDSGSKQRERSSQETWRMVLGWGEACCCSPLANNKPGRGKTINGSLSSRGGCLPSHFAFEDSNSAK